MSDLLDFAERYPDVPGWKARDTAEEAAEAMRPKASRLRDLVLRTIAASDGLTADEVASRVGENILTIRPRCSELSVDARIVDSGERRANASGRKAVVWRLATPDEQANHQRKVA